MKMAKRKSHAKTGYRVVVSHAGDDIWVARQIVRCIEDRGAIAFLDRRDIDTGNHFQDDIRGEIKKSDELLILFTPWSRRRGWIHYEIGVADAYDKRIICVFYNVKTDDFQKDEGGLGPLNGLSTIELNNLDTYLEELQGRVVRRRVG